MAKNKSNTSKITTKHKVCEMDNIPLKYVLGIYPSLEGFPSNEDILYEVMLKLIDEMQDKPFSLKDIKYMISFKISKERLDEFVDYLIENKFIITSSKDNYIMVKSPWL